MVCDSALRLTQSFHCLMKDASSSTGILLDAWMEAVHVVGQLTNTAKLDNLTLFQELFTMDSERMGDAISKVNDEMSQF